MNIYPIFELPLIYLDGKSTSYVLITKTAVYFSWAARPEFADIGDILINGTWTRFWVRDTSKGAPTWEERPFVELPPEYKAWILLVIR